MSVSVAMHTPTGQGRPAPDTSPPRPDAHTRKVKLTIQDRSEKKRWVGFKNRNVRK